jgi:hypothetical protein
MAAVRTNAPGPKGQAGSRRRPAEAVGPQGKDPTQNVLDALDAAVQRIDDIINLRSDGQDTLALERIKRIDDMGALRATYDEKLREAESKRIDAIRLVDVNAVAVANEKATQQAATLQTQVLASAEALRVQTAAIATSLATQLSTTINPLTDRIALLEQAQYKSQGSASVADPAIAKMALAIETLSGSSSKGAGNVVTWIIAGFGFVLTLILIIGGIFAIVRSLH